MEKQVNRIVIQLSEEVKFIGNQVHDLSIKMVSGVNRIGRTVHPNWVKNPVDGWPQQVWMAEYRDIDYFNMPMPNPPHHNPRPRGYEEFTRVDWK